jgi:hypothetical protein
LLRRNEDQLQSLLTSDQKQLGNGISPNAIGANQPQIYTYYLQRAARPPFHPHPGWRRRQWDRREEPGRERKEGL